MVMQRSVILAAFSILIYIAIFGFLIDRPLSLGILNLEIEDKKLRLSEISSPKLVILAGSNASYSHSCIVIGNMLGLPCENAGTAVGLGLDEIFAQFLPSLHRGDIVYMPMEIDQYAMSRAEYRSGADSGLLIRYDWRVLTKLPIDRVVGAIFCCTLADFVESLIEMPIATSGALNPAKILASEYNAEGDRIDAPLADADEELLHQASRVEPNANVVKSGYGAQIIAKFVAKASRRGVIIIGGLPTDFSSVPLSSQTIAAIVSIYANNGGSFIILPNHSRYPVIDFFNSEDHLAQPCQYMHSIFVAQALGKFLGRPVLPPSFGDGRIAATCPSFYAMSAAR